MKALVGLIKDLPPGTHIQLMDGGKFALITSPHVTPYILNTDTGRISVVHPASETQQ